MERDGKPNGERHSDARKPPGRRAAGRSATRGFVERATAQGHSGHGAESVRPHLRDQLRLKALMPSPFPVPESSFPGKDEHHQ